MIKYVDFLNVWNAKETVDFSVVEDFWAEQVREYFRNQPFVLTDDASKTIGATIIHYTTMPGALLTENARAICAAVVTQLLSRFLLDKLCRLGLMFYSIISMKGDELSELFAVALPRRQKQNCTINQANYSRT